MRWLKRDIWKAGTVVAGMLLLLVLMVWTPVSAAGAYEGVSGLATPVTVQATPTEDATVTALNKEKLVLEVRQLQNQNEQLQNQNEPDIFVWLRMNAAILLSTLAAVIGGLIGLRRWIGDRRDARKKQAEERFKSVVEGLGGESAETKLASAVLLRTFLGPDYKEFYTQVFDLAVANLRLRKHNVINRQLDTPSDDASPGTLQKSENSLLSQIVWRLTSTFLPGRFAQGRQRSYGEASRQLPKPTPTEESTSKSSTAIAEPPDSLTQALITAFREAFPRAREEQKKQVTKQKLQFRSRFLDATGIQLDKAFLYGADLREAWMPSSSLKEADLTVASLDQIQLENANLTDAQLGGATLSDAYLSGANLSRAVLENVKLTRANLSGANLSGAILRNADLTETNLSRANLTKAILEDAILNGAVLENTDFSEADLSKARLKETNLKRANLKGANLKGAELPEIIRDRATIKLSSKE